MRCDATHHVPAGTATHKQLQQQLGMQLQHPSHARRLLAGSLRIALPHAATSRPALCLPADDCAIKSKLLVGRRGLAGTVLVHKVAGAAAAAGCSLEEVKAAAEAACADIGTIAASLTECTLFGQAPGTRQARTLLRLRGP